MESLTALEDSLDNLEEILQPLLASPLFEVTSKLDLLQKAKLQVLLPYVVNDLIFIYLKSRGINPKEHSVVAELDRIKQYFDKIKNAEDPEKRTTVVDQQAASRFIKHAIRQTQQHQPQSQRLIPQGDNKKFSNVVVEGAKASEAALAKIESRDAMDEGEESEEESGLEVYEGESASKGGSGDKGKGNRVAAPEAVSSQKRRRGMDPWQGYNEGDKPQATQESAEGPPAKKARSSPNDGLEEDSKPIEVDSGAATPVGGGKKKQKKRKKRNAAADLGGGTDTPNMSGQEDSATTSLAGTPVPSGASTPQPQGKPKKKKKQKHQQAQQHTAL